MHVLNKTKGSEEEDAERGEGGGSNYAIKRQDRCVCALRKAMQADDSEEASQPSPPTVVLVSQSCVACAGLIPQDWPCRFQYCWFGWPTTEDASSTWGETK